MSGTTISGTSSIGITLDSSDTNPVSVTGTITVASGNALYGWGARAMVGTDRSMAGPSTIPEPSAARAGSRSRSD